MKMINSDSKSTQMKRYIYFLLIGATAVGLGSCREENEIPDGNHSAESDNMFVAITPRTVADDPTTTLPSVDDGLNADGTVNPDELMPYKSEFTEGSTIFISQQTDRASAFQDPNYIYAYTYNPNAIGATWESGENFTSSKSINWGEISQRGTWTNGRFSLYALHFPKLNSIRQKTITNDDGSSTILYNVLEDQSTLENLEQSDVMSAFSTFDLFERMRYRLFHLMTYIRVRVYVPVYDNETKTGFASGALNSATVEGACPDFLIEWATNRSSFTQGPLIKAYSGETTSINMYRHTETSNEPIQIPYAQYLPDGFLTQPIEGDYDNVRVYDFSVLIPVQNDIPRVDENGDPVYGTDGKQIMDPFYSSNFLNFNVTSPSGAQYKYYFNGSFAANSSDIDLKLDQGYFQYMELYIPRVGNKVIYVSSKVNPWLHYGANFGLEGKDIEEE